jgi:hypothetical protein
VLCFTFRGQDYRVNEVGEIKANGLGNYSQDWIFLGGAYHECQHITVTRKEAFQNPYLLEGCFGFDIDHGTIREWGGMYDGEPPRIHGVYVEENEED